MYREFRFGLAGAVLWTRSPATSVPTHPVLPDGCVDLVWAGGRLIVAGPDTVAHEAPSGLTYVGVRFAPGWGPALLGVPADRLRDRQIALEDVWRAADVRHLADATAAGPDRPAALGAAVVERLRRAGPPDPIIRAVARALRAGQPVAATAARVGLSARQLQRRCLPAFGYGPKTLARVLRFDRALVLARSGQPFASVAATTGYADQAHLAREVRTLAGVPLGDLLARARPEPGTPTQPRAAKRSTLLPSGSCTTAYR
jgi:AraC-like DNA-binding protein